MTLRKKTLLIMGLTMLGLIVVSYLSSEYILLRGFTGLEERDVRRNVQRFEDAVAGTLGALSSKAGDWSNWDESYAFVEDGNPEFIKANPTDKTFIEIEVNVILIIHSSGRLVFGKAFDLASGEEVPLYDGLKAHIGAGSPLLSHEDTESSHTGLLMLPEGPMLVASRPIVTSEGKGPIRGTLIMGRFLDATKLGKLAEMTHLTVRALDLGHNRLPLEPVVIEGLADNKGSTLVRPLDDDTVAGYAIYRDIYDEPALLFEITMPREVFMQGLVTRRYLILSLLGIGFIFSTVALLLLERVVLSRLVRLSGNVDAIGDKGDFSGRVDVDGNDELATLSVAINGMLQALEESRRSVSEALGRVESVVRKTPLVAIMGMSRNGELRLWNEACAFLYG
ncbi:MAG: CHASE4 domain-containing protein, partial [Acidobacteriota bacterium]